MSEANQIEPVALATDLSERFKQVLQGQVDSVHANKRVTTCSDRMYGGGLSETRPAEYMPLLYHHGFRCELGHDELGGLVLRIWHQTYLQRQRLDVSAIAKRKKE